MALSLQNNLKRRWVQVGVVALVVYIVYKMITGYFGPVSLRINVSNADIEDIVVKLTVKGMVAPLKGGHGLSRYTLHEEMKLVKANVLTEFPKAYMWMALEPVEYTIEVYHPALYTEYKVVKLAGLGNGNNIPLTEINASLISELIDNAKKKYDSATPQQQKRIEERAKDQYHEYSLIHVRDRYVPALKSAQKNRDEIYQRVKQLVTDCEKLFTTFNYVKACDVDEAFLRKYLGLYEDENNYR